MIVNNYNDSVFKMEKVILYSMRVIIVTIEIYDLALAPAFGTVGYDLAKSVYEVRDDVVDVHIGQY